MTEATKRPPARGVRLTDAQRRAVSNVAQRARFEGHEPSADELDAMGEVAAGRLTVEEAAARLGLPAPIDPTRFP